MIEEARLGVAVANSHIDAINEADYVTRGNCFDGVAMVIKDFMI